MVGHLHILPCVYPLLQLKSPWNLAGGSPVPLTFRQKPDKVPVHISEIWGKVAYEPQMLVVLEIKLHFPSKGRRVDHQGWGALDHECESIAQGELQVSPACPMTMPRAEGAALHLHCPC